MSRIVPIAVALTLASLSALSCTARPQQRPDPVSEPTGECTLQWREPSPAEAEAKVVAPFSLTAQDGTGLELISLTSRAVVEDPLAFTELKMVFRNPEDRQIEGRFEINLPTGAAISRFAMLIGDRWQEAEVVELQAARRAYEDFLHRRQDPALLEKNAGNTFSARVFPIPARGVKEIIVSYSESLPSNAEPYRLLLRGLPQLQDLDVDVVVPRASGPEHLTLREKNFMPQKDLELATGRRSAEVGLRYDRLAVARISPDIKLPQENLTGLTLLFDTSASRAIDFRGQVARLGKIVEELRAAAGVDFDLRVLCFDQTVEQVFSGKASSFSADAQQTILTRSPLGASDLTGALNFVKQHSAGHDRLIVVSDGILTAGEQERDKLRAAANDLKHSGYRRIDAIVDGGTQDEISLRQLTVAGLERDGIVVNARMPAPLLASRVLRATRSGMKVTVPGAAWVWPETLDAVQPGDQVLVFADLPPGSDMRVELGEGEARVVPLQTAERPLLERAWVKASIDRLTAMLSDGVAATTDAAKADVRKQILDLSTKYRVLSDYTALLVLETEFDYQRFGIDRTALAEILTVGPAGITTIDRSRLPDKNVAIARPIDPPQDNTLRKEKKGLLGDLFGDDDAEKAAAPATESRTASAAKMDVRDADKDIGDSLARPGSTGAAAGDSGRAFQSAPTGEPMPDPAAPAPPMVRDVPAPEPVQQEDIAMPERIVDAEPTRELSDAKRATRRAPPHGGSVANSESDRRPPRPISPITQPSQPQPRPPEFPRPTDAYEGRFGAVMAKVTAGDRGGALRDAWTWREENPGDELALIALGEVAEASGDLTLAARAYGSLIDLFPGRADLRRMAGERLEALGPVGLQLAIDTFAQAVAQRPDHPSSHRLYAFALLKAGRPAEAFAAALAGARQTYPWGRFAGVSRILDEDLRLIAAAWLAEKPGDEKTIREELAKNNVTPDASPSLRFVLNWETDANDVDFHIYDGKGGHAYYSQRSLASGGELYADVTTGYGPECFTVPGQALAYPYTLQGHYYSRGPMGYGMGKLEVIEHDGAGHLQFKEHPFVIMKDSAYVGLGRLDAPLARDSKNTGDARLQSPSGTPPGQTTGAYTPPPPPPSPAQPLPPTRF